MTNRISLHARPLPAVAACFTALLLILAIATTTAHATGNNWSGRMPAKTWSTNGDFHPGLDYMLIEKVEGPGAMCEGPAQLSGSTWSFPYGWDCQNVHQFLWTFSAIGAYPAVDNPNSQPFSFSLLYF